MAYRRRESTFGKLGNEAVGSSASYSTDGKGISLDMLLVIEVDVKGIIFGVKWI